MDETIEIFFERNKKEVNKTLCWVLFFGGLVFPILGFLSFMHLIPGHSNLPMLFIWIFSYLATYIIYSFTRKNKYENFIPTAIHVILLLDIFTVGNIPGINLYIAYLLPPILSCLYFSPKLTLRFTIISALTMILSFLVRSLSFNLSFLNYTTRFEYFFHNTILAINEFIICGFFCVLLSKQIKNLMISIYNNKIDIEKTQKDLLKGFTNLIEAKDASTGEHLRRTSQYVELICHKLMERNLYPEDVNEKSSQIMIQAASFHDLGKISVPDTILNKPGKLNSEEFKIIKYHPGDGAKFIADKLSNLDNQELIETARNMALCHHEHLDGTGYPYRLVSDEIPVSARIMAVADVLDALLSERPYKKAFSIEQSFDLLRAMSGGFLDPVIVYVIFYAEKEVKIIRDGGVIDYEKK